MIQAKTCRSARSVKALVLGLLLAALLAASMMFMAKPVHAATTFTVNVRGNDADLNINDGVCDAVLLTAGNQCTLRAAIEEANDTEGADTINFNIPDNPLIPGPEVQTIVLVPSLPTITDTVAIDGYTQPGASPNTLAKGTNAQVKVELDGSNLSADQDGLLIRASDTVVRGLAINGFDQGRSGIRIEAFGNSVTGVKIEGNFVGTDASGTQARGNSSGVTISTINSGAVASANTIGGTTPGARNLISGNNEGGGVNLSANLNTEMQGNRVEGNLIGTGPSGTQALGNGNFGVRIRNAVGTVVGGSTQSSANTIAFNAQDGVVITADGSGSIRNSILRNSIFSNAGLGIDLVGGTENAAGATANDPGDADSGANGLQNFPVLASAKTGGGKTTISGNLNSAPNRTFTVQFFSNPSGTDEGKKFIGQKSVTTGSDGKGTFTFVPDQTVSTGQRITATVTNAEGNTSEFSAPKSVVAS
jgi:hypothetical protein